MIHHYEARFKEVTGIEQDLSKFPVTELMQFPIRKNFSKSHGEVFTPPSICDKMIISAQPSPTNFNMDLCAGRGQFTIRMLRKFYNSNSNFDIPNYLRNFHWFNEFNENSCLELIYIFGKDINLAAGPAQELKNNYPEIKEIWEQGIFKWHEIKKQWLKVDETLSSSEFKKIITTELF